MKPIFTGLYLQELFINHLQPLFSVPFNVSKSNLYLKQIDVRRIEYGFPANRLVFKNLNTDFHSIGSRCSVVLAEKISHSARLLLQCYLVEKPPSCSCQMISSVT